MSFASPLPGVAAIIVAAGKGLRAGQPMPKQFAMWRGKPVLRHSAEALRNVGVARLVIAIPGGCEEIALEALSGLEGIHLVEGGETRQQSVCAALDALAHSPPQFVLIHDAARPSLPGDVVRRLLAAVDEAPGAIPVLPVVDSLAIDRDGAMAGSADRETLRRVQTPQAFRFDAILDAHRQWQGPPTAGDDAQILLAHGGRVLHVEGDEALKKLTFAEDFEMALPQIRTGLGYDVHRLVEGEELWLCGIRIDHDKGLSGHSDADVALHALVDAILGAAAAGDIGQHFPPSDPQWKGAPSSRFVEHAVSLIAQRGYAIGNVDLTIICEAPKIGPHRQAMQDNIAQLLGVDSSAVSVKATTTERLGFTGRGEGIAAQAIATLQKL